MDYEKIKEKKKLYRKDHNHDCNLRQIALLAVKSIKINNFATLFNCTTVGRAAS